MKFLTWLKKTNLIKDHHKLSLYPPFFMMGARFAKVSDDYRSVSVHLPLRWYARNHYGTMFGGFMSALADPIPALLCQKLFPGTEVWTQKLSLHFIRPGRSDLELKINFTQEEIDSIQKDLTEHGRSRPKFVFYYYDNNGQKIAEIENIVSIKKRKSHQHTNHFQKHPHEQSP